VGQTADELKREIEDTREDLGQTVEAIGDRVIPGRVIERQKNKVSGGFRSVADRFLGTSHDVGAKVGDAAGSVHDAPQALRSQAQGAPLLTGAVAFAAGLLAAVAFPASETEKRASGQLLDAVQPVKDDLTSTGQEIAEHLKEPAKQAVDAVKSTAGEGVDAVKDTAKQATQAATSDVKDAVTTAKTGTTDTE